MNRPTDPVEQLIFDGLVIAGVEFEHPAPNGLDFHVPGWGVHIECKRQYTPRIEEQMRRTDDVIVIQGLNAAVLFSRMINYYRPFNMAVKK